MAMENLIKNIA